MTRHAQPLSLPRRLLSRVAPVLTGRPSGRLPRRQHYASAVRRVGPSLMRGASGWGGVPAAASSAATTAHPRGSMARLTLLRRASALLGFGLVLLSFVLPAVAAACGVGPASPAAGATPAVGAPLVGAHSPCGSLYVVQGGDTLSAIALHCQVPLSALQAANPNSDPLAIGRILAVPGAPAAPAMVPASQVASSTPQGGARATAPAGSATIYVIRAGDTLSALALRFGTTVAVLARYNGLTDPNRLRVGQMLRIPAA